MCGITGYYLSSADSSHPALRLCQGGLLNHRGPDGFAHWQEVAVPVGLQHYRLAILDLSATGVQPMHSVDGRYVIAFNGEIYNHLELRARLEYAGSAPAWRGSSDTETLLACISAWGVVAALEACTGMFAIGLYDRGERRLTLVRDRLGEKPLYYGYLAGALVFASEPKVFQMVAGSSLTLDSSALAAYMRLGYVPGDQSIFQGIKRLPPGCTVEFTYADVRQACFPQPSKYWQAADLGRCEQHHHPLPTWLEGLDKTLRRAVKGQMLADVPLGALLSGGIDSSLVVAMMQAQAAQPIKTFSVGLKDSATDEAPYARKIASYLGTDHHEVYVSPADALEVIPHLPQVYCEPFADSSQIPTLLIAGIARQSVKVVLTGDGGDELFGGYDRYFRVASGWKAIGKVPPTLRRGMGRLIKAMPAELINRIYSSHGKLSNPADRAYKIAGVLGSRSAAELNREMLSLWRPALVLPGHEEAESVYLQALPQAHSLLEQLMLADTLCYLPDDLLVKVDRAAMAVSLESRAPFLDHQVVELAWSMPESVKIIYGEGKVVLKQLLARYLPQELYDRPKQGFGIPLDSWLKGPLRDWGEALLSPVALQRCTLLDVKTIRQKWQEYLSGERNWQHQIWTVLMFQAWYEQQEIIVS